MTHPCIKDCIFNATLQSAGLEVILCNGKFTKNIKGKKTDVQDCQWIQKLHTLGLLSGSFLPDEATEQLRTYCRHRTNLLEQAAGTTNKMQKYLRLLNLRLDVVVKDVVGLSGLAIIDAICKGETNPEKLAAYRHGIVKNQNRRLPKFYNGMEEKITCLHWGMNTRCIKTSSLRLPNVMLKFKSC